MDLARPEASKSDWSTGKKTEVEFFHLKKMEAAF